MQKNCSVINIYIFNIITKENAYSMQTQTNMIFQMTDACFITVVNTAAFSINDELN